MTRQLVAYQHQAKDIIEMSLKTVQQFWGRQP